jgi:hypothetical protein
MMLGMVLSTSSFVLLPVHERVTKAKHCQTISGLHTLIYWVALILGDFLNYLLIVAMVIGVIVAFDVPGLVGGTNYW